MPSSTLIMSHAPAFRVFILHRILLRLPEARCISVRQKGTKCEKYELISTAQYLHCHGASSLERRPRCRGREWRPGGRSAPGRGPGSWLGPFAVRSHTDTAAIQTMDTTYSDYQIHSLHSPTFAFLLLGKVKFEEW